MKIPDKAAEVKEWNKLQNIPAWDVKKARSHAEVIMKMDGKTVHVANLMDLCNLKNAELAKHLQIYKARVVLREDNVKDEEGYRTAFAEQGGSASQMAAAKFLDTISKLPGMAGETSDAVSAYTQEKMTEALRLLRLPKGECPEIWIRNPPRQRPKGWDKIDDPVFLLERNFYGHPLAGLLWESKFEEVIFEKGWEKVTTWECLYLRAQKNRIILTCLCGRYKNDWKEAEHGPYVENSADKNRH